MIEYLDVNQIKPAPYNPRRISDGQIEELKRSIKEIGFIIPVLVNKKNNVIVAGHQRTKASKSLGLKEVPVLWVENINIGDEMKLNQVHNIIDLSKKTIPILKNTNYEKEKFIQIKNTDITESETVASCVKEQCKLILKYGNILSCVICKNQVLLGSEYVKTCKLLNIDVNAYICDDNKYEKLKKFFNQEYGEYCYDNLKKNTFVQGLAQLHRSTVKKEGLKQYRSVLYETMVIPYLKDKEKETTILDFGCGKGAYIEMLAKRFKALGVEFYNNNGKQINVTKGNSQIDNLIEHLKNEKQFDVVVCDSVLNSTDSMKAEESILDCLNLFAKEKLFISGRSIDAALTKTKASRDTNIRKRFLEFLDENNFSANYREGNWYYQHYHDKETITKELEKAGFKIINMKFGSGTFQIECKKVKELPKERYIEAINYEFNLPLPNDKTYNRHEDVKKALNLF